MYGTKRQAMRDQEVFTPWKILLGSVEEEWMAGPVVRMRILNMFTTEMVSLTYI
jgi:hypothetical protein